MISFYYRVTKLNTKRLFIATTRKRSIRTIGKNTEENFLRTSTENNNDYKNKNGTRRLKIILVNIQYNRKKLR